MNGDLGMERSKMEETSLAETSNFLTKLRI